MSIHLSFLTEIIFIIFISPIELLFAYSNNSLLVSNPFGQTSVRFKSSLAAASNHVLEILPFAPTKANLRLDKSPLNSLMVYKS